MAASIGVSGTQGVVSVQVGASSIHGIASVRTWLNSTDLGTPGDDGGQAPGPQEPQPVIVPVTPGQPDEPVAPVARPKEKLS